MERKPRWIITWDGFDGLRVCFIPASAIVPSIHAGEMDEPVNWYKMEQEANERMPNVMYALCGEYKREEKETQTTMEPQTRTFNLTEPQLAEVRKVLGERYGLAIDNTGGVVKKDGFSIEYAISKLQSIGNEICTDKWALTITLNALPILVSPENAWSVIVGTVNASIKKFNG